MASSCPDDSVYDSESDCSSVITAYNGSSKLELTPDRYGFIGGAQYTEPGVEKEIPVEVLRRRELKWLDMLANWDRFMLKKYKKVRDRCRKGIPPSLRARAWQYLCGAKFFTATYRHKFLEFDSQPGDPKVVDDIKKDLHRQFPLHEMFANQEGHGQADLFRILKAFSVFNPAVGYCQAQAPIAAVLLMHMPAEQAFWCLVAICEKYLPGYYSPGLEAVQMDGDILFGLLRSVSYPTYKHFKKQKIEPILYMTEWFMCVFSRTLPWSTVLRVWDMFLCEGIKVQFRIGLVLIKQLLGRPEVLKKCPSIYETLEILKHLPPEICQEDFLVVQSLRLPLSDGDMEKEHQKQVSKRRQIREQKERNQSSSR